MKNIAPIAIVKPLAVAASLIAPAETALDRIYADQLAADAIQADRDTETYLDAMERLGRLDQLAEWYEQDNAAPVYDESWA